MLPVIGHTPSIVFESHNPQIHGHITGSIVVRIIPIVIRLLYEGENETYIEASVENSSSILYDKEIRNKPRTRRTKRNV